MPSNGSVSSCMSLEHHTCNSSNESFATCVAHLTSVFSYTKPPRWILLPTRMLIGPAVPTHGVPLPGFVFTLGRTWSPGLPNGSPQCLVLAPKRNIAGSLTALPNPAGSVNFSMSFSVLLPVPQLSIATMSVRCISRPTQCSTSGRSLSRLIFTLFEIVLNCNITCTCIACDGCCN